MCGSAVRVRTGMCEGVRMCGSVQLGEGAGVLCEMTVRLGAGAGALCKMACAARCGCRGTLYEMTCEKLVQLSVGARGTLCEMTCGSVQGRMCAVCAEGLSNTFNGCKSCEGKEAWKRAEIMTSAFFVVLIVSFLVFSIASGGSGGKEISANFDILINFLQVEPRRSSRRVLGIILEQTDAEMASISSLFNLDVPEDETAEEDMSCDAGPISVFALFYFKLGVVALMWGMMPMITLSYAYFISAPGVLEKLATLKEKFYARFWGVMGSKLRQLHRSLTQKDNVVDTEELEDDLRGAVSLLSTEEWNSAGETPSVGRVGSGGAAKLEDTNGVKQACTAWAAPLAWQPSRAASGCEHAPSVNHVRAVILGVVVTALTLAFLPVLSWCFEMLVCQQIYYEGKAIWVLGMDESVTCPNGGWFTLPGDDFDLHIAQAREAAQSVKGDSWSLSEGPEVKAWLRCQTGQMGAPGVVKEFLRVQGEGWFGAEMFGRLFLVYNDKMLVFGYPFFTIRSLILSLTITQVQNNKLFYINLLMLFFAFVHYNVWPFRSYTDNVLQFLGDIPTNVAPYDEQKGVRLLLLIVAVIVFVASWGVLFLLSCSAKGFTLVFNMLDEVMITLGCTRAPGSLPHARPTVAELNSPSRAQEAPLGGMLPKDTFPYFEHDGVRHELRYDLNNGQVIRAKSFYHLEVAGRMVHESDPLLMDVIIVWSPNFEKLTRQIRTVLPPPWWCLANEQPQLHQKVIKYQQTRLKARRTKVHDTVPKGVDSDRRSQLSSKSGRNLMGAGLTAGDRALGHLKDFFQNPCAIGLGDYVVHEYVLLLLDLQDTTNTGWTQVYPAPKSKPADDNGADQSHALKYDRKYAVEDRGLATSCKIPSLTCGHRYSIKLLVWEELSLENAPPKQYYKEFEADLMDRSSSSSKKEPDPSPVVELEYLEPSSGEGKMETSA
ncbi:hypothetical protein CYMTET_27055 [Cymbomonas tetramitiformis]|uniref:Uncharacterized protein n=1 Tax=Cymbomonas tetramitiformis TaxID=36881 RepID=A0AAE0FR17_9CHLO|nr:hypothetical protein CYMTET_27055 [Cymbomonas tetramitiformis]